MKRISTLLILLCLAISSYAVDIIILKNSNKIEAVIQEVSKSEVKYKKASSPNGPTFTISTSEINSIVYDGGDVQVFTNDNQHHESDNRQQASTRQQQNDNSSSKSTFTLQDAPSFYSITINYSHYRYRGNDYSYPAALNGFNAGFLAQSRMYKNLVLLWGVEYQFCGTKESGYRNLNHNLKAPVRLGFSMPVANHSTVTAFFGPSFDFNVSSTIELLGDDFKFKVDFISGKYSNRDERGRKHTGKEDGYKILKCFDIPLGLGAMYKYKNFGCRLQYEWGLINRFKSENGKVRSDQFTIGVLYSF